MPGDLIHIGPEKINQILSDYTKFGQKLKQIDLDIDNISNTKIPKEYGFLLKRFNDVETELRSFRSDFSSWKNDPNPKVAQTANKAVQAIDKLIQLRSTKRAKLLQDLELITHNGPIKIIHPG